MVNDVIIDCPTGNVEIKSRELSPEEITLKANEEINDIRQGLRIERSKLFHGWDTYKQNVNYGLETETLDQRTECLNWYTQWLKLPDLITADNIQNYKSLIPVLPLNVKKYL